MYKKRERKAVAKAIGDIVENGGRKNRDEDMNYFAKWYEINGNGGTLKSLR